MDKILEVKKLKIAFRTTNGTLKAVRDISFDLERGKTLAIVGESGSGKSVTSKAIIGILAGNAIVEGGEILYDGKDLLTIPEDEMHRIRGDKISMIFQDPLSSLNPIVKIGKQITEAMLLKNKTSRREARKDFNGMLGKLKKNILAAGGQDKAKVDEMISTFDKFNIRGNQMANQYNQAHSEALDLVTDLDEFIYLMDKKSYGDLRKSPAEMLKRTEKVKHPFLTGQADHEAKLTSAVAKARAALSANKLMSLAGAKGIGKEESRWTGARDSLVALRDELNAIATQTQPDYFRIGFYQLKHPGETFAGNSIDEINDLTLRHLDEHFMIDFLATAQKGVEYSFNRALEKKKAVIPELIKAREFYQGDFEKNAGLALCKRLTAQVEESIDELEVVKDSAAYTFGSSLSGSIERYFTHKAKNPREEARFARQSRRRDALIAKGKNVTWKVVPKNVYDLSELRENIVAVIDRLLSRYNAYIEAAPQVDYRARSVEIVDYLKDKAGQVVHRVTKGMAKKKAIELMDEVGIHDPMTRYYQYPFEFSGGMRQRIVIAIALAANPDILICDEPTTALDVTIQAQILELINKLKKERNLSVIFITHDLGVVANMADDIAVMYAGKIVEYGTADDIFYDPRHPYTWALLSSMPDLDTKEKLDAIPGTPPNMIYPPVGDAFAERNKYALKIDFEAQPPMFRISDTHSAATWLLHPDAPAVEMPRIITDRIERMKKAGGEANAQQ